MSTVDDRLIKRAGAKIRYTPEMLDELEKCTDEKTGPAYFMKNFMYIQHPLKGKIKFTPFKYQEELCEVYNTYQYSIALVARQMGKCLEKDTNIRIKNKKTGEIREMTMEQYHDLLASKQNNSE